MAGQQDLSVNEALSLILNRFSVLDSERAPLTDALGRVLARPVVARDSLPPFANSSMDGYALRAADIQQASRNNPVLLRVVADIAAGTSDLPSIDPGAAARIMTGAPMPPGADAVVPVENTDEPWRDGDRPLPERIAIYRAIGVGDYVRYPGEDIRAGTTVLEAGHVLQPAAVGVLASLGVTEVEVVRRPRVGILATGDELVPIEAELSPGKIRNSNSYAQSAQVVALGGQPVMLGVAADSEADVRARLDAAVSQDLDLLVSSAGVSVGVYDVVKAVLDKHGDVAFWRVRMRPGKPLAFGAYRGIPYIGLPGNPVSAMVSFERFARPAILKMAGHRNLERPSVRARLAVDVSSDGRESYLRAIVTKDERGYVATITGSQGSHIMTSLVKANALLIVPEGMTEIPAGTALTALMIDWSGNVF